MPEESAQAPSTVGTQPASEPSFVEVLKPMCLVIREVVEAALPLVGASPGAESPAMNQIASQHLYASTWWPDPVESAFTGVRLRLLSACDALRAYGKMFEAEPVPLYAHLALARVNLDAAAVAYWLAAPVVVEERVKRNERLRSIMPWS